MMKIEVFEEVLKITKGEDLADILYQKSPRYVVLLCPPLSSFVLLCKVIITC